MASRSFKPASYLASAQPSKKSSRPSFARTSSSSSTHSNHSEDSFIATLRSLSTKEKDKDKEREEAGATGGDCHTPVSSSAPVFGDTPSRKRSKPIFIEIPKDQRGFYTPLSARGDLPGGYFPNHETLERKYKTHPFRTHDSAPSSPTMSNASSAMSSPTIPPRAALSPPPFTTVPGVPELSLPVAVGKYHPSNYKLVSPSTTSTSTSVPALELPAKNKARPGHVRRDSDVKRKLRQYQQDMIAQARMASTAQGGGGLGNVKYPSIPKPLSPRLAPLGSPGPITPFELEGSAEGGYLVAGARTTEGPGAPGGGEREMVGSMIGEELRRGG